MDEITHTIMPSGGQWGGTALGAGVGGLIGSLHAICKTKPEAERPRETAGDNTPPPLIKMEDLINDRGTEGTNGRNAPDNPGERRKNNR